MPTIVDILIFMSMINTAIESLKARKVFIFQLLSFYEQSKFHAQQGLQLSWKPSTMTWLMFRQILLLFLFSEYLMGECLSFNIPQTATVIWRQKCTQQTICNRFVLKRSQHNWHYQWAYSIHAYSLAGFDFVQINEQVMAFVEDLSKSASIYIYSMFTTYTMPFILTIGIA